MNEPDRDNRPRCEHLVVYPMENCTVCMRAEIAEMKAKKDGIVGLATKLVGNACDRHSKIIQSMDFDEFRKTMVLGCGWCNKEQLAELKAKLAAPMSDQGRTHWDGCWQSHGHHTCAIARAKEAVKRGMERAISIAEDHSCRLMSEFCDCQRVIASAIRAEIEKVNP